MAHELVSPKHLGIGGGGVLTSMTLADNVIGPKQEHQRPDRHQYIDSNYEAHGR